MKKAYETLIDPFLRANYDRREFIDDLISPIIYKHAIALQEKFGYYGEAFGHFDRLYQKGHAPAAVAIKRLANAVIQASSSSSPKTFYISLEDYLQMAKAFADPSKTYYDEVIASSLYSRLYQLAQASAENAWWLQVKASVSYILGRRLALGLGIEKDEKAAYSLWSELDTEQRGLLIGHCVEAIRERRKRATLPQGEYSIAADDVMSEPLVQFLQDKIACCSLSSEKAKRHLELASLFRCLGNSNEAWASLKAAAALDSNALSAKDWGLLGDLQQSGVLQRKEKESTDQKQLFSRAAWNQPLASYLQAIKKARADTDRVDYMTLALNLIKLICYDDPEQERGWGYAELSGDNAKTILSIPSLCGALKPEHLYALCLKVDPLMAPALPNRPLAPGVDEPQASDAKLASEDYLHRLLEWADSKQETDTDIDLVDRLLLLTEIFDAHYAYSLYFRDSLTKLFQTLNLPALDSDKGVISPLLTAARTCAGSSVLLQRRCAEKLWQLGNRKAISLLRRFARFASSLSLPAGDEYRMNMAKNLIVDLFENKQPLPSDIIQWILKSPALCAELPEETIYACSTRLDTSGQTPLMQAVRLGDMSVIQFLLAKRIRVEQANDQRETAFSIALRSCQFKVAWLLLSNSQVYWHRLLFGLSIFFAVLVVGVGLLLFFYCALAASAFACFAIAGLGFLFACYQFLRAPENTHTAAKSSLSLGLSNEGGRDFLSAASLSTNLNQPCQSGVVAEAVNQQSTLVCSSDTATSSFCLFRSN